jgi:hypothetical protein
VKKKPYHCSPQAGSLQVCNQPLYLQDPNLFTVLDIGKSFEACQDHGYLQKLNNPVLLSKEIGKHSSKSFYRLNLQELPLLDELGYRYQHFKQNLRQNLYYLSTNQYNLAKFDIPSLQHHSSNCLL